MLVAALALCALKPQVTDPNLVEVLARFGEDAPFVDSGANTWAYFSFPQVESTPDGGWYALARIKGPASSDRTTIVIGQQAGALNGPIEVLRTPDPSAPIETGIRYGAYAEGRVATVEATALSLGRPHEVRLDGQIEVAHMDAVTGAPGWIWEKFGKVYLSKNGGMFVTGMAIEPTGGAEHAMLTNEGTGTMLVNGFDFVPGLNRRVIEVMDVWPSPSGDHWAARALLRNTSNRAILVDGAAYEIDPGYPTVTQRSLPPSLSALVGSGVWQAFRTATVNDEGDVALSARVAVGLEVLNVSLLNGQLVEVNVDYEYHFGVGVTPSGLAVQHTAEGLETVSNRLVEIPSGVDLDGDGAADGTWLLRQIRNVARVQTDAPIHMSGIIGPSLSMQSEALLRARRPEVSHTVCTGVANSTGRPGSIVAVGSPVALTNEIALEAFELPAGVPGYALLSRMTGAPSTPPGSVGELCLAGDIGRLVSGLFITSSLGGANVPLDLTALPQPSGTVPAMAGETWYAQAWHRDAAAGLATSNFTDAIRLEFL